MSNQDQKVAVTRVANACVLLEMDGHSILTDPWFTERWYLRRGEPLGLDVTRLAPLTAIVATSFAANHWDLRALREYRHKSVTPVYVSTSRMARQARALGYPMVERLRWDEVRELAPALSKPSRPGGPWCGPTTHMRSPADRPASSSAVRSPTSRGSSDIAPDAVRWRWPCCR
jgi:hypothetical protein